MAKGKRSSSRRPVSRERIAQAKYAKQHGLISKRAKLQNGRLSRAVEKKVEKLNILGAVPEYEFRPGAKSATQSRPVSAKPIKLPSKLRADAKAKGYDIFGGKIIAPNQQRKAFETALKKGRLAGSIQSGGSDFFKVNLGSEGINTFKGLLDALNDGELDDILGDNLFSFTYRDYHPRAGVGEFLNGAELAAYLEHYQFDDQEFDDFELWVLPPGQTFGKTPDYVYERDRASGRIGKSRKPRKRSRSRMENQTIARSIITDEMKRETERLKKQRQRAKLRNKLGEIEYKDLQRTQRAARRAKNPKA